MPSWPHFEDDEIQAVAEVLASGKVNYWTGSEGREFEREFASYVGTDFGLALMNGTVTMELALYALEIGPGDEVIVPSRTFAATATAVVARGARPVFCDIDSESGNMTPETVEPLINPNTKAIIPVHLGGWPCDMNGLLDLAASRQIAVIEDCAQAHGAKIQGRSVGSFGDINSWSFCQDKIMTLGGEGGAITTDSEAAWRKMWAYKDHGKSYEAVYERSHEIGYRWLIEGPGTNWRMTELQAVLGRRQLLKLDGWVRRRQVHFHATSDVLANCDGLHVPEVPGEMEHAAYRWYGYLDPSSLMPGYSRDRICAEMGALGYWCQVGSCCEIYREKAFEAFRPDQPLANAAAMAESSLCLLVHPTLSESDVIETASVLRELIDGARR